MRVSDTLLVSLSDQRLTFDSVYYRNSSRQLRRKRRRTQNEMTELARLPARIALLEIEIDELVAKLGSEEFRNMPEANGV